jgi:hypothetical protein
MLKLCFMCEALEIGDEAEVFCRSKHPPAGRRAALLFPHQHPRETSAEGKLLANGLAPHEILMTVCVAERKLHAASDRNSHVLGGFTCRSSLCGERQLAIRRPGGARYFHFTRTQQTTFVYLVENYNLTYTTHTSK